MMSDEKRLALAARLRDRAERQPSLTAEQRADARRQADRLEKITRDRQGFAQGGITKRTDQDDQILMPGIAAVTDRDRIEAKADQKLTGKRPQQRMDIGLFDNRAPVQYELFGAPKVSKSKAGGRVDDAESRRPRRRRRPVSAVRLNRMGFTFDEDTYREAKPLFREALTKFQDADRSLLDFVRFVLDNFGEGVEPYLRRFHQDLVAEAAQAKGGRI